MLFGNSLEHPLGRAYFFMNIFSKFVVVNYFENYIFFILSAASTEIHLVKVHRDKFKQVGYTRTASYRMLSNLDKQLNVIKYSFYSNNLLTRDNFPNYYENVFKTSCFICFYTRNWIHL